ncbi:MAG: ATP-binding protein [Tetrasphaera sp.]|nr:ATP-binding protein [Tetrasphaera sp.]
MTPTRADLVVTLGCVTSAACITVVGGFGLPELLFFGVMLTSLAFVAREAWRAGVRARVARREAAGAARIHPDHVAAMAVRDERRRLSEDIPAELRRLFIHVRIEAAQVEDHAATARRIHRHARLASSELRRLLGLLRDTGHPVDLIEVGPARPTRIPRRDLAFAAAAGVLALVESITYGHMEQGQVPWWGVALTVIVAIAVAGRTLSPTVAALFAASSVALGAVASHEVLWGFWMLITVTGLVWGTMGIPGSPWRRTAAMLLFAGTAITSAWVHDHENAVITTVVVCVLLSVALIIRVERGRAQRALGLASHYRSTLDRAAAAAVEADRAAFAREIHDSVSHAVGLIAMQAGAAEVSADRDPESARRALEVVESAAIEALADLDRLHPESHAPARTPRDVAALVDRIRASGTSVTLSGLDQLPPKGSELVYRIVQEALTNVVRHGRGAPASVSVESGPGHLTVTVTDSGPGAGVPREHGSGLVGLAERVAHAGGRLHTGTPAGGRGFVVKATLPASRAPLPASRAPVT